MTGIGRYVEQLTKALAAAPSELQFDVASTREDGEPTWLPPTVNYRRVRGPRRPVHLAWTAAKRPRLERLAGDFDLLHALHPSFPLPTQRPAVITVHDVMPIEHPEWYEPMVRWGFRETLRYAIDHGWHFIADSDYVAGLAGDVAGIPRDRISVVHLAVDDEFREPVSAAETEAVCATYGVEPGQYVLTLGAVSMRKNAGTVVRAIAAMPRGNVRLVLAGRADASGTSVRSEIARLGLDDRVRLPGFVADEDLRVLMQGALALAHPAVDEGFGLPPLEAMAGGTPVVAARAGSLPEVVGDAGLLIDPLDDAAWAQALTSIAGDRELAAQLGAAGRAHAAAFTWERVAAQTLEVYERALK
jgi:alpha-1,3-rhamnosyl/mannosyltransferase